MHSLLSPRVNICCISSIEEAHTAIRLGADALALCLSYAQWPWRDLR